MITPHQLDIWSASMGEIYNSLEGEMIRILIRRLSSGSRDITEWQAQKLQELRLYNNEVARHLADVMKVAESEIVKMFEDAGGQIIEDIDKAMPFETKPLPQQLDTVLRGYARQSWLEVDNYVNQTLITTNYGVGQAQVAYQSTLNRTAAMFNTGMYTMEQALERAVVELAQNGIKSTFIDQGGHTWSMERYTRTVLKSTLSNTYDEIRKERMSEYGVHTVIVTAHAGAREQCEKIQGNVVDLRQNVPPDSEYKSIYDPDWGAQYGTPGGHRGVNCEHLHMVFVPGVNTNNQPTIDPEYNQRVKVAKDTQRRMEREIVKYKKNAMITEALESDTAPYWKSMVRKRQGALRKHISANDEFLSRNYKREKVYTPLDTLLNDFSYKGD
ncbi:phage minor capsid protein [Alkalicoccobacillus porphyridii]|uniref:Capsid protein n=1 Tax=Alkalicoccobacillus porphyridii TaxID=2597270 RepID=A0A554A0B3_9BACI|nr:phage minor capsid protein [Alkalicoccobacillus porphyridii]TSB47131.1 capsid protein [Alkalicoccobacillus porphyridii]